METKQRNKNLIQAKKNKNDEFYTVYEDVANELEHYKDQLKGKAILCPCDYDFYNEFSEAERNKIFNGEMTDKNDIGSFSRYLYNQQDNGWNNTLYFSHYNPKTGDGVPFEKSIREFAKKHPDGIVITNPPFSLFNKFMEILQETNLKFLIMGNKNSIIKKEIFELIKEHKIWLGYSMPQSFKQPNGDKTKNLKGVVKWFTNLDVKPRKETMALTYSYYDNPELYPKYDNYDAINIDKTKMIPYDYDGYMGVPFTFLEHYNPEQFEILGITATSDRNVDIIRTNNINTNRGVINGKELYARIIIKNKQPELPERY